MASLTWRHSSRSGSMAAKAWGSDFVKKPWNAWSAPALFRAAANWRLYPRRKSPAEVVRKQGGRARRISGSSGSM